MQFPYSPCNRPGGLSRLLAVLLCLTLCACANGAAPGSAQDALDEAQRTAQRALDEVLARDQGVDHASSAGRAPDSVTRATAQGRTAREGES